MSEAAQGATTPSQPSIVQTGEAKPALVVVPPAEQAPAEIALSTEPPAQAKGPDKNRMAERFAQLARRERAVVERQQTMQRQIAAREAELRAGVAAFEQERARYRDMTQRLEEAKTKPKEFLRSVFGDDYYDHITKLQLFEDNETTPALQVQSIREELQKRTDDLKRGQEELQAKIDAENKAAIEAEKARLRAESDEAISTFEKEAIDFVKQNAAKYELTTLYGRQDLVPLIIKETYELSKKSGNPRLISPEEAAAEVEKYLAEEVAKAERLRQQKAKAEAAAAAPQSAPDARPIAPTLTNAMGGSPTTSTIPKTGDIYEDAMRRAAAKFDEVAARRPR